MTGKRTPPNVKGSLAIAADSRLCIFVSELDFSGYRIGRATGQWIRLGHHATNSSTAVSRTSRGKFRCGHRVRRRTSDADEDLLAANYDIANDGRQDYDNWSGNRG